MIEFFDDHGKFVHFKSSNISEREEVGRPQKLVRMYFTLTSTCMNILSRFYFLTPMDYIAHCSMGKFEGKLGAYVHIYMNYVHDFDVFYVTP